MEVLQAIAARRSIRKFVDKDVSSDHMKTILEAGSMAPTAGNMQPWEFIVVKDRKNIEKLVNCTYTGYLQNQGNPQQWIMSASLVIAVCIDIKRTKARYGDNGVRMAAYDTSAAIENMILAAVSLDLGTCWVGGFNKSEVGKILELPEGIEAFALLPVGYFINAPSSPPKFNIDDIVHYEVF